MMLTILLICAAEDPKFFPVSCVMDMHFFSDLKSNVLYVIYGMCLDIIHV